MDHRRAAGILFLVGAVQFAFGMHLAEILYPGYNISQNYISDLGATCRETCIVREPSATIFNASTILFGAFVLIGAYLLWREFRIKVPAVLYGLTGVGVIGVGWFPETAGEIHEIASNIAFLFGGLATIASYKVVKKPFAYFSLLLGITSLVALGLHVNGIHLVLGPGGMERMVVFPLLFYLMVFGGYLLFLSLGGEK